MVNLIAIALPTPVTWNMPDEDIAKFVEGVYKSGALLASRPVQHQ
jgi:hypothetical protein